MGSRSRIATLRRALVAAALLCGLAGVLAVTLLAAAPSHARAAGSLGGLQSQLGAQQARSQSLSGSIAALSTTIGSLDRQIALVRGREAAVRAELGRERAALTQVRAQLGQERARLGMLRTRLATAQGLLAAQLRSGYEAQRPSLVNVVLEANGFNDLLTQLSFLGRAEDEQKQLITLTTSAKRAADEAAARLATLRASDARIVDGEALQARALAGMNGLLGSRQTALNRARAAQSVALAVSVAATRHLRSQIASVRAAQLRAARAAAAAAAAAAARAAASSGTSWSGTASGGSSGSGNAPAGGSGGWAIPEAIVMCESGGQNLPPNSAGASGYYQIMPATWKDFGGVGPAAWLTSLAEQSAVATRIWNGGAGASNWVCAGIVGIH